MSKVNFRETQLWKDAKALILETYRITADWPKDGESLAADIRSVARMIVRTVPGAFRKADIAGNVHLRMGLSNFGEMEALLDIAEALGFVEAATVTKAVEFARPVEAKLRELNAEAKRQANELMRKRTSLFGKADFDDDDDD